jgi:inorganic pyrophosphatase
LESLDVIDIMVEIPRGGRNKYEYDEKKGVIRLDRVLYSSVHYPVDYGLIPGTRAPDGDHLDVLVVVEEPTFPGCHMTVRPIGMLRMVDEKGEDFKILAVPTGDPRFDGVRDLQDLSPHWLREIENFFQTYKFLEGVPTQVCGWEGAEKAKQTIVAYTVK